MSGDQEKNPMYPIEHLDEDDDNGTMPENVKTLADAVVGHRIVSAQPGTAPVTKTIYGRTEIWELHGFILELDNGTRVLMEDDSDCCAYTSLTDFLLHADKVDHIITEVGTTEQYTRWHIYADMGDVLELTVGWSCGNPFYYGYGFDIHVIPLDGLR